MWKHFCIIYILFSQDSHIYIFFVFFTHLVKIYITIYERIFFIICTFFTTVVKSYKGDDESWIFLYMLLNKSCIFFLFSFFSDTFHSNKCLVHIYIGNFTILFYYYVIKTAIYDIFVLLTKSKKFLFKIYVKWKRPRMDVNLCTSFPYSVWYCNSIKFLHTHTLSFLKGVIASI